MNPEDRYTYRVVWSDDDEEFVGLCAEFPSLSHLDSDRGEALNGITALVRDVLDDMRRTGEEPPEPIADQKFSGQLRVRMPPALHRRLALEAKEKRTSINALIIRRLSA